MANSLIGVFALCLVVSISGYDVDLPEDEDIHTEAVIAPREDRFDKTTGKKLKVKKTKGTWKPKNSAVARKPREPDETPEEAQSRQYEEFALAWKKTGENYKVSLSPEELQGLDTFWEKVNDAGDWSEMKLVLDGLGKVGQITLRENPSIEEDIMVPSKNERQEAARKFLKLSEEVKKKVFDEKTRLHAEFVSKANDQWMGAWQNGNADKARRLSESDSSAQRQLRRRGVPRRPLGDGEKDDLPLPGPPKRNKDL